MKERKLNAAELELQKLRESMYLSEYDGDGWSAAYHSVDAACIRLGIPRPKRETASPSITVGILGGTSVSVDFSEPRTAMDILEAAAQEWRDAGMDAEISGSTLTVTPPKIRFEVTP